jgi:hypothetical protein
MQERQCCRIQFYTVHAELAVLVSLSYSLGPNDLLPNTPLSQGLASYDTVSSPDVRGKVEPNARA